MIRILNAFVIAAFIYGFSYADVDQIKEKIMLYSKIVIEESRSERHKDIRDFVKMMEDITTHQVARKLYIWIQSWHENGLFMNSKLLKIDFKKIQINKNKAEVITEEKWRYNYFDRRINKKVLPDTDLFYRVRYHLSKVKDRWIITDIKVLKEKKISQEGDKK